MTTSRTPAQRAADVVTVYEELRAQLTNAETRAILDGMRESGLIMQQKAADAGDYQGYAGLVQASLNLQKLISANDRAAMLAAAIVTQSGVVRPQLELSEE